MNFSGSWKDYLYMVELSYNNCYQKSIQMAPFEVLYGLKCRSPLYWDEIGEQSVLGLELITQATKQVKVIREDIKAVQNL